MELKALGKMFMRWWWLILPPVVIVGVITAPELLRPPGGGFAAAIHLTAAQPPGTDLPSYRDASLMPWTASESLTNAMGVWIRTRSFADEINALVQASGQVTLPAPPYGVFAADIAHSVINLTITWPDADQLAAIAEAAVTVLQTRTNDYFPQLAAGSVEVTPLDPVIIAPAAPGLMNQLRPLLKIGLALLVGIGLAALAEYLDDTIRSRDDLEEMGLPVLAELPRDRKMRY